MISRYSRSLHRARTSKLNQLVAAIILLCAPLTGCNQRPAVETLPQALVLFGKTQEFIAFLNSVKIFENSPLTTFIADFADQLANCKEFELVCNSFDACTLADNTGCRGSHQQLTPVLPLLGEADWMLSSDLATQQRITAWGSAGSNNSYEVTAELRLHSKPGPISLLIPAAEAPARAALAEENSLIHFLIRPDGGLSLDPFITAESMGSKLFQLKSELFLATTLEGTWEGAFYSPAQDDLIPPMALALHTSDRNRAVQAMEEFISQLMNGWPIRRSPYSVSRWSGACISNLRVMPGLAPCYVATDRSLIIGWNPTSIEQALAQSTEDRLSATASSALIAFDRIAKADVTLGDSSMDDVSGPESFYSWTTALISGQRVGELFQLKLELSAGTPQ
jgi:hypothetical protein